MNQANDDIRKGVVSMLIASFCFALVGACTRLLRDSVPSVEIVFFRNVIGVVFILYSIWKQPLVQTGGKPGLLAFRGIIGTLALYMFFYSITQIGLAESITYQQTYPIFIAVFSIFIAGERLLRYEWAAVFLGFGGICLIFVPQMTDGLHSARNHLIGLTNAVLTAFAYLSIRGLSNYYDSRSIVLSFMLSGIILPIISMTAGSFSSFPQLDFLISSYVSPQRTDWLWIFILGVAALIGQVYLTKAFCFGKAGIISAVGFSNIVFSVFLGVILGDTQPGLLAFAGIVLVIVSGIFIGWKTRK
jgi:drug/metabolite transporter (DMT)-like permease